MDKFLFVEGTHDEIFVKKMCEKLQVKSEITIVKYSQMEDKKVNNYMESLLAQKIQFLFVADSDIYQYNSVNDRINELQRRYNYLVPSNLVLAVPEIEGWYIAGLDGQSANKLKLRKQPVPDKCTKEKFESILPSRKDNTIIRNQILDLYDIKLAQTRSSSFKEFITIIESW